VRHAVTGVCETLDAGALFVLIGAAPHTDWLNEQLTRDAAGFIRTGADVLTSAEPQQWPLRRAPMPLETSLPGVFAVGDVRRDSTKRVASAVGEGAVAVQLIHKYLHAGPSGHDANS
jgi:thioredoxin reductase (NADPH)